MALSSATVGQQSARREAERVAAFIQGHINRENIAKRGLWFQVEEDNIQVWHGFSSSSKISQSPDFKANSGCKYTTATKQLYYHIKSSSFVKDWILISDDTTSPNAFISIITDSVNLSTP